MKYIAHRVNTVDDLSKVPKEFGIEVDLRDNDNDIIIQHDPFEQGENFKTFLKYYDHDFIVLNIKTDGIEFRVLDLLKLHGITNYFFLDVAFPSIIKLIKFGEKNIALRFSEFESLENIKIIGKKVNWVWADCFTKIPFNKKFYDVVKDYNLKVCFVSPELQNQEEKINQYINIINRENFIIDAVCTKRHNISKWKKLLKTLKTT